MNDAEMLLAPQCAPVFGTDVLFAVEETRFAAALSKITPGAVQAVIAGERPSSETKYQILEGGIAVFPIVGVIVKRPDVWMWLFGGTSTLALEAAVQTAAEDPNVKAGLMLIDSPGGAVDGLAEAGDALDAFRKKKPLYAQGRGMIASAAFYLGAQADRIVAQRTDLIGSVGTRMMFYDWSKLFANEGVRAVPIDTGEFKSAGALGTVISERHQQYFQGLVDAMFADFVAALRRGRGVSTEKIMEWADGRVFPAAEALSMGMIDGVQTIAATLRELRRAISTKEMKTMNNSETDGGVHVTPAKTAATISELKAAFPKSDAAFRESCLERGLSLAEAKDEWLRKIEQELEAVRQSAARAQEQWTAQKKIADRAGNKPGVEPAGYSAGAIDAEGSDPIALFESKVADKMKLQGMDKTRAVRETVREHPDLHQAYLKEYNARRKRRVA